MAFEVHQVPVWNDNYAYVLAADDGTAAVVDSPEADPVLELIDRLGLHLTHLFNTHHHPDHVGSNVGLLRAFPGLHVFGGVYDGENGRIPGQTKRLADGYSFKWGGIKCRIRDIKAHTLGHISYLFENGSAFVGDTLFFAGCGRLFEGTAQQLDRALYEVLGALPGATRIYCAHEYTQSNLRFAASVDPDNPDLQRIRAEVDRLRARGESTVPSTLEVERQVNPFLRCDTDAIRRATGHGPEAARHEVLGALRRMKDHF